MIVAIALTVGVLAAAMAYQISLDLPNDDYEGLVLTAAAGLLLDESGEPELDEKGRPSPVLEVGDPLTPENLDVLRTNRDALADNPPAIAGYRIPTGKIRVQKFSFARWGQKWTFAAAVIGMLLGAGLVRASASRQAVAHRESGKSEDLLAALSAAQVQLGELLEQSSAAADRHAQMPHVVARLSEVGVDLQANFVEHLAVLRSLLATGTMAEVMEAYAVAERSLNRARSTAVDNDPRESLASLAAAAAQMGDARDRLAKALAAE
ncbi:MAG: hypothetical protein DWQ31_00175 [Planctomycetota bacterium]|nr:MAG: hypothetical protein DWQ31_00175 [Planctomycetota bacterium]REK27919.1 MAG: hypothetical protein DWQ42_06440 [Planctomycetota bacterium]REK40358.1 MAG: hypothetical protein DWQ46_16670 [Planctomycetota bacterium]